MESIGEFIMFADTRKNLVLKPYRMNGLSERVNEIQTELSWQKCREMCRAAMTLTTFLEFFKDTNTICWLQLLNLAGLQHVNPDALMDITWNDILQSWVEWQNPFFRSALTGSVHFCDPYGTCAACRMYTCSTRTITTRSKYKSLINT